MQIRRTGDWAEARRIMRTVQPRFTRVARQALLQEAHFLRTKMVQGITSGAPGGRAFRRHSPITRLLRQASGFGGSKILMASGGLRNTITVVQQGSGPLGGVIFVGVHRNSKGQGGKPLVNIAAVQEFGIAIRMTAKMRAFLFARLREAGAQARARITSRQTRASIVRKQRESKRRAQRAFFSKMIGNAINQQGRSLFGRRSWASVRRGVKAVSKPLGKAGKIGGKLAKQTVKFFKSSPKRSRISTGGGGGGALGGRAGAGGGRSASGGAAATGGGIGSTKGFIVIPPRPFIAPILQVYGQPHMIRARLYQRIAKGMNGDLGRG